MNDDRLSATELHDLLVSLLADATRTPADRWREVVPAVERLPIALHPRSNWRATPIGTAEEIETVGIAVDVVRVQHPYIRAE